MKPKFNILAICNKALSEEAKTHPKDYIIAIRFDGVVFRVDKDTQEADLYSLQFGDRPCAFRAEYFDFKGHLREKFWNLPILKNLDQL